MTTRHQILIETFALKIFDEKRNEKYPKKKKMEFFITDAEVAFHALRERPIQDFITRLKGLRAEAAGKYQTILSGNTIEWNNLNHVRAVVSVCQAFQDFSFIKSASSDLYQLVFYNFANAFKRDESAQFLTPLPVIEFLVKIVNPRDGETVVDPCCGIADFLSLAFVNASQKDKAWHLDDANIYGVDLDDNMIMLAKLNMLLNGDGEAKLDFRHTPGSILAKFVAGNPPVLVDLIPDRHKSSRAPRFLWTACCEQENELCPRENSTRLGPRREPGGRPERPQPCRRSSARGGGRRGGKYPSSSSGSRGSRSRASVDATG